MVFSFFNTSKLCCCNACKDDHAFLAYAAGNYNLGETYFKYADDMFY